MHFKPFDHQEHPKTPKTLKTPKKQPQFWFKQTVNACSQSFWTFVFYATISQTDNDGSIKRVFLGKFNFFTKIHFLELRDNLIQIQTLFLLNQIFTFWTKMHSCVDLFLSQTKMFYPQKHHITKQQKRA